MSYPRIPDRTKGENQDIVNMFCTDTEEAARDCYQVLESRLRGVNDWTSMSDKVKTGFSLFNSGGTGNPGNVEHGNLIRIDIPGAGNPSGNGYDWTEVIDIQTGGDKNRDPFCSITISPCTAPGTKNNTVAHFYTGESTNTFIVRKIGCCVYAEVHGRNETENISDVPILDTLRNKAVAIGGKFGLGSINWSAFTEALLEPFKK